MKTIEYIYRNTRVMLHSHIRRTITKQNVDDIIHKMFEDMLRYKGDDGAKVYLYEDTGKPNFGLLKRAAYRAYATIMDNEHFFHVDELLGKEETREYFNKPTVVYPKSMPYRLTQLADRLSEGYEIVDLEGYTHDDLLLLRKWFRKKPNKKRGPKPSLEYNKVMKLKNKGLTYREIGTLLGVSHVTVYNVIKPKSEC